MVRLLVHCRMLSVNSNRTYCSCLAQRAPYPRSRCVQSVGLAAHSLRQTLSQYNRIFKAGTKFIKEPSYYTGFIPLRGSFFQKSNVKEAMSHRNLYSTYFTREATRRAEPLVQNSVSKFLNILQLAALEKEPKTMNLSLGFRCLSSDVITNLMFDKPLGWLESPDFDFPMTRAVKESSKFMQPATYFPTPFRIFFRLTKRLPSWFLHKYAESMALTEWWMTVGSLPQ